MSTSAIEVRSEEVTFRQGDVTLAGTLLMPASPQPCPALVCVHGSGDETRENSRMFAAYMAQHGIAALIYDKRGVGQSTGNWRSGTFRHLADDAIAAVHMLQEHPGIDPQRVGLVGFSEGGWVAPLAAARSADVAFLIAVSAAGMSPFHQEIYRRRNLIAASRNRRQKWGRRVALMSFMTLLPILPLRVFPGLTGYFGRTMHYRTLPAWQRVQQPVLAIYGESDTSVPPIKSAANIERALIAGGNTHYTILRFPHGTHGIWLDTFDQEDTDTYDRYVPGYLDSVIGWIMQQAQNTCYGLARHVSPLRSCLYLQPEQAGLVIEAQRVCVAGKEVRIPNGATHGVRLTPDTRRALSPCDHLSIY